MLYADEVNQIIGAAIEVHKELGSGFLESVYEEALGIELSKRKIPYENQMRDPVYYKGMKLTKEFIIDCMVYDKIIVELKCIPRLTKIEEAQIINYIKATNIKVGLLINFGSHAKLDWKRYVLAN